MNSLNNFFSRIMSIGTVQRQSIISLIWQIGFTIAGFISTIYFAHAVGANVMGTYFLFGAYLSIIGIVADGGFGGAALKRISEGVEKDAYFSAFVVLRSSFLAIVLIALIVFRKYFVDIESAGIFVWLILALIVSFISGAVSGGIGGCGKIGIQATGNFIDNISRIIVQIVAVFLGFGVAGLIGGAVFGMLMGALVQLRFLDLHFKRFGWKHLKSLSTFSFWIFLISSGSIMFMNADTVMIGYYLDNTDVGIYRILLQFTILATFTANALRGTLYPLVSRWGTTGEKRLIEESLSRAFTYSFILAIPLFMGGILLGDKLLYFFYGREFVSYETLVILFAVQIVNIFQYFFSIYLSALDRLKELFKITVIAISANILLNAILIPTTGINGAAIATFVTMALNALFAQRILSKMILVRMEYGSLLNIMKASAAMSIFILAYRMLVPLSSVWATLVPVVVGFVIYVFLILKFDSKIYEELNGIMQKMNVA